MRKLFFAQNGVGMLFAHLLPDGGGEVFKVAQDGDLFPVEEKVKEREKVQKDVERAAGKGEEELLQSVLLFP